MVGISGRLSESIKREFIKDNGRFAKILPKLFTGHVYGVEVGVHIGTHAKQMLEVCPSLMLVCIDLWEKHVLDHSSYLDTQDPLAKEFKNLQRAVFKYQRALKTLKPYSERIEICKKDSVEVSERFSDEEFDFVYVDGDHSYEGCLRDLKAWWPKVSVGGILAGHDYFEGGHTKGVVRAVNEFVMTHNLELVAKRRSMSCDWMVEKCE